MSLSRLLLLTTLLLISVTTLSCTQPKCVPEVPPSIFDRPALLSPVSSIVSDSVRSCSLVISLSEPVLVDRGLWFVITVSAKNDESLVLESMGSIQDRLNFGWLDEDDVPLLTLVDRNGARVRYNTPYKGCAAYEPKNNGWIRIPFSYFDPQDWRDPVRTTFTSDGWIHAQSRVPVELTERDAEPPAMASLNTEALWSEVVNVPNACIVGDLFPVIKWMDEPESDK